eukprot:2089169-Pleurochrysis_carterae.AAC.2
MLRYYVPALLPGTRSLSLGLKSRNETTTFQLQHVHVEDSSAKSAFVIIPLALLSSRRALCQSGEIIFSALLFRPLPPTRQRPRRVPSTRTLTLPQRASVHGVVESESCSLRSEQKRRAALSETLRHVPVAAVRLTVAAALLRAAADEPADARPLRAALLAAPRRK